MSQLCHCHYQEEKHKLSPAAERKLVKMVKSQPKTTKKQVCNEVEVKHFASPWAERLLCKKEDLASHAVSTMLWGCFAASGSAALKKKME